MREQVNSLNFQLASELRVIGQRVDQINGEFSKEDLTQKIQHIKGDQNKKLKNMYQALEDMGNLQASLVETVNTLKMQVNR